jgi:NDP-sugar pyrophosphorylase family protein
VDVLSGIDLGLLMDYHVRVKNLVTLCVRQRVSNRYFLFDSEKRLTGWKNTVTGEERFVTNAPSGGEALAFSGIHVIGPGFFEQALAAKCFPISNPVFPVVDVYLCLAACGGVMGYEHTTDHWIDIGTVRNLENIPEVLTNLINRY